MAYATLRTFPNVKSSAITPRHPSVPNFNSVISAATLNPFRLSDQRPLSVLVQPFHNLADVLRAVPRANQQRVARFDNDDVFHSDRRDEFPGAPEEIPIGVESLERPGGYVLALVSRQQFVHRRPRSDVAPSHLCGNDEHAARAGLTRGRLHDRIVYRNVFELRILANQHAPVALRSDRVAQAAQRPVGLRQVALQGLEERSHAEEKHSRVPLKSPRLHILFRACRRGLFREPPHGIHRESAHPHGCAFPFDIAEARIGAGRRNPQHHQAARLARNLQSRAHNLPVALFLGDELVRRKHGHQGIFSRACPLRYVYRREPDGRSRIPPGRFAQDSRAEVTRKLSPHLPCLLLIRNRPDARSRKQWRDARHGLLEHRPVADDVEKLFWRAGSAARPEPRPAPSGENYRICLKGWLLHRALRLIEIQSRKAPLRRCPGLPASARIHLSPGHKLAAVKSAPLKIEAAAHTLPGLPEAATPGLPCTPLSGRRNKSGPFRQEIGRRQNGRPRFRRSRVHGIPTSPRRNTGRRRNRLSSAARSPASPARPFPRASPQNSSPPALSRRAIPVRGLSSPRGCSRRGGRSGRSIPGPRTAPSPAQWYAASPPAQKKHPPRKRLCAQTFLQALRRPTPVETAPALPSCEIRPVIPLRAAPRRHTTFPFCRARLPPLPVRARNGRPDAPGWRVCLRGK